MVGVASSATAVLVGYIAAGTKTIRVGSGGVMLPNHAPLVVAEQFGTLGSIYPGRIDLGLGRAPGTDQLTAAALRRNLRGGEMDFPDNVQELMNYFLSDKERRTYARPSWQKGWMFRFGFLGQVHTVPHLLPGSACRFRLQAILHQRNCLMLYTFIGRTSNRPSICKSHM